MVSAVHRPLTLTWICAACGGPWHCQTRRGQLLARYTGAPARLALVLGSAMVRAAAELREVSAGDLHSRFIGWLPGYHCHI